MHKNYNSCFHIFGVISLYLFFHTISSPLYNLKTIGNISMKLGTLIKNDEMMCHAKES